VGFLTARGGNRLGAVMPAGASAGTPAALLPARSGRVHLQAVLAQVHDRLAAPVPGRTDLAGALDRLGRAMRRRGLAVVVSDFLDGPPEGPAGASRPPWVDPMRMLASRHEVLAIEVVDPRELALPDVGVVRLEDPETGGVVEVQTSDRRLRRRFAAAATAQRDAIATGIRAAGADHLVLRTDRDWLVDLARFVAWRRQRVDALARVRR
jgi:uncharacterized protein (DUF58 family)